MAAGRVRDLARAVLDDELVQVARAALQADERHVLRRGIELAGLVMEATSAPAEAKENSPAPTAAGDGPEALPGEDNGSGKA